jgi:hypothetical protein
VYGRISVNIDERQAFTMRTKKPYWTILLLLILAALAFAFSPYQLGTLRDFRGTVVLRYWHVIDPDIKSPSMINVLLKSRDTDDQTRAAFSAGLIPPNPSTLSLLQGMLDRSDVAHGTRDVVIWSLGELRHQPALGQLVFRVGDTLYNQENLQKAIEKIKGERDHDLLP